MRNSLRWTFGALLTLVASAAAAEFHTFQIEELFSNADGTVQYVVLHESAGMDGENLWQGKRLVSTSAAGSTTYTFRVNLPGGTCGYYGCVASPTANRRVLVATEGFAALGLVAPDFVVPNGFLATGGGALNFASVDQVTYPALPSDGVTALARDGTMRQNVATNFAGATASVAAGPTTVAVIEYYHAGFDHYFITSVPTDISALDGGAFGGVWARTGYQFKAYAAAGTGTASVCRFFSTAFAPKSSHFYTPYAFECNGLKSDPGWQYEDSNLVMAMPDANGNCAAGFAPVYRFYNNFQGAAPNHRYTTDLAVKAQMLAKGYTQEGPLPGLAFMCSPP